MTDLVIHKSLETAWTNILPRDGVNGESEVVSGKLVSGEW